MLTATDNWDRKAHPMKMDPFGVWELTLPAKDGQPAIAHESKIKVPDLDSCARTVFLTEHPDHHDHPRG